MPEVRVSPYRGNDFGAVVDLLGAALHADHVSPELFTRRVLLDPNFSREGALVARDGSGVTGFLLAVARRHPLEDGPDDRERGWITLVAVREDRRRRGVGSALVHAGESYLRARGCRAALVSPYAPGYWTPGVDEVAYPHAVSLFEARGYVTLYRPLSMQVTLTGPWRAPDWSVEREARLAAEGVRVQVYAPGHAHALMDFARAEFPGDWQRHLRETLVDVTWGRRPADDVLVAQVGTDLVGFAQHEGERFGPFGVAAAQRGRGIGAVLLYRSLESMRRKGLRTAYFLWTDDRTAERVYAPAGFTPTRRYSVLRRDL